MKIPNNLIVDSIEKFIFASRWILVIMYVGLIAGLGLYTFKFVQELIHMAFDVKTSTTEIVMLSLLGLVDISMVGNLVMMVIGGGFSIFVKEINPDDIKNRPRFMNNITSASLKTKLSSSLIGITSIHLLKVFVHVATASEGIETVKTVQWGQFGMLMIIYLAFVISTIALSITEKIGHSMHLTDPKKETH